MIVLANLAEAQVGAIAYGVAGMIDPSLQAPHLVTSPTGRQPPAEIAALLRAIVTRPDSAAITPRFRRFLSRDLTDWYRALTADGRQWTFAGCDAITTLGFTYLGSPIAYACHARSARASAGGGGGGGGTAVSVFYTADWRAAGVEGYGY